MSSLKEKHIRWMGIPVTGFILTFVIKDPQHEALGFIYNVVITIIFTAVLWNGVFQIIKYYRRTIPSIELTAKRLILTSIMSIIFLIVGANILRLIFGIVTIHHLSDLSMVWAHAHINIMVGFVVTSLYEGAYFFGKWKESVILNEALKNQQVRTQFAVLQNQMSPHFLFNSLNTLTTLISENQKLATDFTQKLSEVYRYILQNKEKQLTTLREELLFCDDYLYLQKIRYPDNLNVLCHIDEGSKSMAIAPMTLQMLTENSIKHNVVSKNAPLSIEIFIEENEYVVVRNNFQPKTTLEKSTKTGLENIKKRYAFFTDKEVVIQQTEDYFLVKIPLIALVLES